MGVVFSQEPKCAHVSNGVCIVLLENILLPMCWQCWNSTMFCNFSFIEWINMMPMLPNKQSPCYSSVYKYWKPQLTPHNTNNQIPNDSSTLSRLHSQRIFSFYRGYKGYETKEIEAIGKNNKQLFQLINKYNSHEYNWNCFTNYSDVHSSNNIIVMQKKKRVNM